MIFTSLMKILPTLFKILKPYDIFFKFAELDFSEIIKLSIQLKNSAYLSEVLQISIYPYSPEKVQFPSLIFLVNLILPTRKLPHKANFTKIIYLSVQIKLDKKLNSHPTKKPPVKGGLNGGGGGIRTHGTL